VDVARETTKPIFVIWGAPAGTDDTYYRRLLDGGLPVFRTFGNCVGAARAYVDYWQFARRYRSPFPAAPTRPSAAAAKARRILGEAEPGAALSEHRSKALLAAYGIRSTRDRLCASATEAVRAARALRYPVVMKVSSPTSCTRAISGSCASASTPTRPSAPPSATSPARRARPPDARDGSMACSSASRSWRRRDGPRRLPGRAVRPRGHGRLGGVFVEVLRDVAFRVPPFAKVEAPECCTSSPASRCSRACAAHHRPTSLRSSTSS